MPRSQSFPFPIPFSLLSSIYLLRLLLISHAIITTLPAYPAYCFYAFWHILITTSLKMLLLLHIFLFPLHARGLQQNSIVERAVYFILVTNAEKNIAYIHTLYNGMVILTLMCFPPYI